MSTNSRIGIEQEDGTVKSIYCHWDGYPSYNGFILNGFYKDRKEVETLINLGNISVLGKRSEPNPTLGHSFDKPQQDVTIAYGRDRGEDDVDPRIDESVEAYLNSDVEEYGYLFTKENKWVWFSPYDGDTLKSCDEIED
jgi:hypothetical protein